MNPFKDVFKDCDRKFTQPQSRGHNFITQNLFNERLLVAGSLLNRVGCLVTWLRGCVGCVGPWVRGLCGSKYFLRGSTFYVGHNFTWVAWVNIFYVGCVGQTFYFYFILFLLGLAFIY